MRPGRPATGWRASSRAAAWSAWSRRRARSRARRVTASRPIAATPSSWCGCCWPASCTRSACPGAEEEALRDLVRAREAVRVDLMRCRHRLSKLLLRHGIRFEDGRAWTDRHRAWLAGDRARLAGGAGDVRRRVRRRRRARAPPRRARARDRRAAARLALAAAGRAVALPARDRHADRRRAVRRDRRLRALRARRAADELRRARPLREHAPASSAGSARSPRPAPATPAGCWSRPPGTTARGPAIGKALTERQDGQPAAGGRDRLERPTAPAPHLEPARSSAPSAARSSPSPPPANSPASAGRSPASNDLTRTTTHPVGWVGGGPAHARGTRDCSYEQPAPTGAGHARS